MQQNNEQIDLYQTDEIDLKKLYKYIVERKFLIFGFSTFVTLIAIIYALILTPIYKTDSYFTKPVESAMIHINKLTYTNETASSVFALFLNELTSKEFQRKVFLDGGYLTLFNPENNPIDNVPIFISNTLDSLVLSRPELTKKDIELQFLNTKPYSISIEGTNPKLIGRYLNELIDRADEKVINDLIKNSNQKVDFRLSEILLERKSLLLDAKQKRLNEIVLLKDAATIAKSLGIIDNNFNLIGDENITSNYIIAIGQNQSLPDWYLYGETALTERINVLNTREIDEPFIPQLAKLETEKFNLGSAEMQDMSNVNSMQLQQIAITPILPIKPKKRMIVMLAFFGSFMMSIFLTLIMGVLRPDEQAD
ncbi:Wzz/FepE/Etk N-terminal domain-containing protein [Candidatus Thioglobus sp.]|nr:Wzz/FepE/Etk N-terminal domain-containing protein [Candidatus Thioglobus sp.]